MPKILIVDDEPNIVTLISRYVQREGYDIVTASDGREAIDKCKKEDFDVIIMDVMMPDTDGFTACKKIKEFKDIPVIMLSARGTEFDKLFGFEVGVDDYVTKPFSPMELMARIKVVISRKPVPKPESADSRHIVVDGIDIDTLGRTVLIDGEKADLTAKEYALFLILVKNKGIVLSRDRILNEVWGYDSFGVDRTVDWQIKLLRSKLGAYRDSIKTVRGVGYKFET
jgi:DNA-binding response OmpR family regulator